MEVKELNNKISSSIKWTSITEILTRIISPFVNMILARLLSPEEFGVIATVTMVTSFADIFTDAGFQKYLVQHDVKDDNELNKFANVAFWTNFLISICIWVIIAIFSNEVAAIVGDPGLGHIIVISSFSLILTSFSSIQTAIYKRKFDFKTLFQIRIVSSLIPIVITVPMAYLGFSYWSLVIGTIFTNFINALILTLKSTWKPKFYYKINILKKMFSFSMWILFESILLWLTSYAGTFIVRKFLTAYYLGIYKNSLSMVNSILSIVVSSTVPVLLSALSKLKNNKLEYDKMFYEFQQKACLLLIPIGVGVFLFRDLATNILFGPKWAEASFLVGLYALVNAVTILTGQYISIAFTSKGYPKLAVLSQILQLFEMVPILLFSVKQTFFIFVIGCCTARFLYGVINLILSKVFLKMSPMIMLKNMISPTIASILMAIVAFIGLKISKAIIWQFFLIFICFIIYTTILFIIPETRNIFISLISKYKKKITN